MNNCGDCGRRHRKLLIVCYHFLLLTCFGLNCDFMYDRFAQSYCTVVFWNHMTSRAQQAFNYTAGAILPLTGQNIILA